MKSIDNKILSVCMSVITPLILMFGFYIQFHGKVSPGGGFQSGIVFAIPFIVYIILYSDNTKAGKYLVESNIFKNIGCLGVMIYLFTGIITNIMGGKYLEYAIFISNNRQLSEQIGIFSVETGVCLTVFGAMCTIFKELYNYINRGLEETQN